MNKIKVELDLHPNALVEIIPELTMHSSLGETVHVKVEIGPAVAPRSQKPAKD